MKHRENSISRSMGALHRYRRGYVSRRLEPHGISGGQFLFLLTLSKKDGISQEEISDFLSIDKTTTAKALKKLEASGYLIRERDDKDRRAYQVYLTQKGRDILPLIRQAVDSWENEVTEGISGEELRLMESLLHRMLERATEISKTDAP